jgi:hypothetical protein
MLTRADLKVGQGQLRIFAAVGVSQIFTDELAQPETFTRCSHLKYWGLLTDISVQDDGTVYTVDRLRKLTRRKTQQLVLRSTCALNG